MLIGRIGIETLVVFKKFLFYQEDYSVSTSKNVFYGYSFYYLTDIKVNILKLDTIKTISSYQGFK